MSDGATVDGVALVAPNTIGSWMASGDASQVDQAIAAWQTWIDVMAERSLYNGLFSIFSQESPPGGTTWQAPDDYEKFAALGSGFGGFGPLYQVGFLEIVRLVVNGLETNQVFVPGGIEQLAAGFLSHEIVLPDGSTTTVGDHVQTGVTCGAITETGDGKLSIETGGDPIVADKVIVATTHRSMEIDTEVARFGDGALVETEAAAALREIHIMNSSKIFVRTATRFWENTTKGTRRS